MDGGLAVAVHLGVNAQEAPTAACDFVEYRDMGSPAHRFINDGRSVRFQLQWASFEGELDVRGDLRGTWVQGARRISVVLRSRALE
ncbi:MAG: hypothetical protein ACI89X_002813 [Planctomycetota bacterium]|jgi:hypothetical protein